MYLSHYGFTEYPFSLTPDTAYFYAADAHRDALNVLTAGLRCGEGFMKVTAEIGLGKTLLCRQLLRCLDGEFGMAYLPDPQLTPASIRAALAHELGMPVVATDDESRVYADLRRRLLALAASGLRTVVIVDEAHRLPDATLEAIRLLTNLETEKSKLLQVVLFGQPELDRRLARVHMRQLRQRIGFSATLAPLDAAQTATYLAHRTTVAGNLDGVFSGGASDLVHRASRGTPRLVNVLAHKTLMAGYGEGVSRVDRTHVRRAIRDTESVRAPLGSVLDWFRRGEARSLAKAGR